MARNKLILFSKIYNGAWLVLAFIACYVVLPISYYHTHDINIWIFIGEYIGLVAALTLLIGASILIPFACVFVGLYFLPFMGFFLLMSQQHYLYGILSLLFWAFNVVLAWITEDCIIGWVG